MKRKIFLIINVIFIISLTVQSQPGTPPDITMPRLIPASPQASTFIRYGEIPVSLATGVPNIEIPIYTIETGKLDIPISISYHASGIKVRDISSSVGLGWTLNAGGIISRSAYGLYDNKPSSNSNMFVFRNISEVENIISNRSYDVSQWEEVIGGINRQTKDTQSDRYFYSCNGMSGILRYNSETNEMLTVPYAPLKIRVHSATEGGFCTITDTKGISYIFTEGEELMTQSSSNQYSGISSYYLTKIEFPGIADPVVFTYRLDKTIKDTYYSQIVTDSYASCNGEMSNGAETTSILHNNTSTPWVITGISWRNTLVEFSYQIDGVYSSKARLSEIIIKNNGNVIKDILLDNKTFFSSNNNAYRMKLDGISFRDVNKSAEVEKYRFSYNTDVSLPLYCYETNPARFSEDYWGYYNGKSSSYQVPERYYSYMGENQPRYCADRSPDEYSMKAGVIKEITYPTGGKTEFIFEANRATNVYSDDPSENITGGLRIHQIINRSSISSQPEIKTYKYVRGGSTETIDYTQFIYSNHTYELYDWAVVCGGGIGYDPRKRDYPVIVMKDSPLTPLIGWGNSPVFYRDVIEYIGTEANNKGWTEYEYIPSDLNYSACIHEGMNIPLCFSNALDCDRGLVQPLLHKETEYDNSGQILRETTNDYGVKKVSSFITGVRISNPVTYKPGYEYYMTGYPSNSPGYMQLYHQKLGYFNSWAYRDVYTLDSTTIIEKINGSDIKQTTLYNYDEQLRILEPVSTDMKNSSGESLVTKIKFPFNFSTGIYPTMTTLNMLSYNVQTEKYKNNSFIDKFIYNYKYWDIGGYAIENIMRQNYNQTSPETLLIYNNYNAKGNPVYITQYDVNKIVYLWGYNHQYLIAEIKNATYSDVSSALVGITPEQLSASTIPDMSKVEALRQSSTLSKAQITTYTYKPLVGILTQTDPRGVTTYYNYDTFNRLQWIKDVNEKLIQSFDYNYKQ